MQNGSLNRPTVKKFEFHKSKMADGRHFKSLSSYLSNLLIDFLKFGTVMHVGPQSLA